MSKEKLGNLLKDLEVEYEKQKKAIIVGYCMDNNTVKVGDVFTDHIGSILVDKIQASFGYGEPCCVYHGVELTKKLEPNKRGKRRSAYQSNAVFTGETK